MPGRGEGPADGEMISGRSSSAAIAFSRSTPAWTCGQISARNGRIRVALVAGTDIGHLAELSGQDAMRQRRIGDDGDAVRPTQHGIDVGLGIAPEHVVAELVRVDAADLAARSRMCGDGEIADADGADLAGLARRLQRLHARRACRGRAAASGCSRGRYGRSASRRRLASTSAVIGRGRRLGRIGLRGEEDLAAPARQEGAVDFLGMAAAIAAGGIEMADAARHRRLSMASPVRRTSLLAGSGIGDEPGAAEGEGQLGREIGADGDRVGSTDRCRGRAGSDMEFFPLRKVGLGLRVLTAAGSLLSRGSRRHAVWRLLVSTISAISVMRPSWSKVKMHHRSVGRMPSPKVRCRRASTRLEVGEGLRHLRRCRRAGAPRTCAAWRAPAPRAPPPAARRSTGGSSAGRGGARAVPNPQIQHLRKAEHARHRFPYTGLFHGR